ncbi:organic cation transporter protein-like [Babylonia areolata]|uniref:organic cation transporter protein-like n=1 Tax=Babylonia areolata TaxID=304850 RepID=UPI003FD0F3C0
MDFDAALKRLGEFGKYQKRLYLIVSLPVLFKGYQVMLLVFTVFVPKHRCAIPGLSNDTYQFQSEAHRQMALRAIPSTLGPNGQLTFHSCLRYTHLHNGSTHTTATSARTYYDTSTAPHHSYYYDDGAAINTTGANGTWVWWGRGEEGTEECTRWVYDQSEFTATLITKFDLVCGRKQYRAHSNMMMMAGFLAGSSLVSVLCDWMGRKRIYFVCLVVLIAFGIASAYPTSPEMLLAFRFLSGTGLMGMMVSGFVLVVEIIGGSSRTKLGAAWQIVWVVGAFVLAALSYLLSHWRPLQLAGSVPPLLLLVCWWWVPESPRWLVSKGRIPEAMVTLTKVAQVNGTSCPPNMAAELEKGNSRHHQQASVSPLVVFQHSTLCVRFVIVVFSWAVISMTYYGLSLNVSNLSGGVRVNFVASVVVELLGYLVAVCLLDVVGRKHLHSASMLSAGVACLLTIPTVMYLPQDYQWVTTALAMLGKMGVSSSFAIIYLFSAELYPTVLRNFAVGSGSVFARIGSMLSPYIADLALYMEGELSTAVPLIVFGILALGAGLSSLLLPETLRRTLPDTVHDAIHFGRKGGRKGDGGGEEQGMTADTSLEKEEEEEGEEEEEETVLPVKVNGEGLCSIQQPDTPGQTPLLHSNHG